MLIGRCAVGDARFGEQRAQDLVERIGAGHVSTMCGRSGWVSRTAGDVERVQERVRVTVSRNNTGRYRRFGNCYVVTFPVGFDPRRLPNFTEVGR